MICIVAKLVHLGLFVQNLGRGGFTCLQADEDSSDSYNNFQSEFRQEHKTGNALVRLVNVLLTIMRAESLLISLK